MSLKPKYKRITQVDAMMQNGSFKALGCHSWILINKGNVNITIAGTHVLYPGEAFSSPEENPEIADYTELDVAFDAVNDPITKAADTGTTPVVGSYVPGIDPVPDKANKLVIYRSLLSIA